MVALVSLQIAARSMNLLERLSSDPIIRFGKTPGSQNIARPDFTRRREGSRAQLSATPRLCVQNFAMTPADD
jgi:hypothetical protein